MEVLAEKSPAINALARVSGSKMACIDLLEMMVLSILDFYGADWNERQIRDCAEVMYQEYHWLQLSELKHFCAKVKASSFGKLYGKLAPYTLTQWMREYAEESLVIRADQYLKREHEEREQKLLEQSTEEDKTIDVTGLLVAFVAEKQTEWQRIIDEREQEQQREREAEKEKQRKYNEQITEYARLNGVDLDAVRQSLFPPEPASDPPSDPSTNDSSPIEPLTENPQ